MRLGEGFLVPTVPVVEEPRQPTFEELRNEQLLVAIAALQDALLNMPRPEVHVEAPDLTAIVQAVTGLKPGATSEDIAEAVVRQISPATPQTDVAEVLGKIVKALEKLDFRMSAGTGGSVALASSDITDRASRQIGEVTVKNFPTAPTSTEISNDVGNPIPVSGTVTVANPTAATDVSLLARETTLQNVFAAVDTLEALTGQLVTATQALLTNTQLRASAVSVTPREQRSTGTLSVVAASTTTGTSNTTGVVVVPAEGSSGFAAQIIATTSPAWVGSVITEYSQDNGTTWTATAGRQSVTGASRNSLSSTQLVTQGTYTGGLMRGSSAGATHYRVRLVANTAGSITVNLVSHHGTGAVFSNTVLDVRQRFQYLCSGAGGRVGFNATTPVLTTSTAEQLLGAFQNPAGSGQDLTVYRIEPGASAAGKIRRYRGGTLTVGTAQTPMTAVNRGGGTNASVAQFYPGTRGLVLNTTATGGTLAKVTYMVGGVDDSDDVNGTITLRPGEMSYWTVQTNAGAGDATLELVWADEVAAV